MLELTELSRIGFGGYRITERSREHYEALTYALDNGCNIVDTSSNYTDGDSERLIGKVLEERPHQRVFVITKAGYVDAESLNLIKELNLTKSFKQELVHTTDGSLHSLNPDFLSMQINRSCERLKKKQLDGFLLHNPEYFFEQDQNSPSKDEYYRRIKKAFEFLEDEVKLGRIRYYGISSNTFATTHHNATNLLETLTLAEEISINHHFKLIQFPFNLIENDAQQPHFSGQSLIELAQANSIVKFSNRPLNANLENNQIRLATYEDEIANLDESRDHQILEECLRLVRVRLEELEIESDILEFIPLQVINLSWNSFSRSSVVDQVFEHRLYPFLNKLYEENIPDEVLSAFGKLRWISEQYSKKSMTQRALVFKRQMVEQMIFNSDEQLSLSVLACKSYLDAGVDHILVGMRKTKYVDNLKSLF